MSEHRTFPADALNAAGLNRHFVFDLAALPTKLRARLGDVTAYRQLILLGHGGQRFWEGIRQTGISGPHPVDDYTLHYVQQWLADQLPGHAWRMLYPGSASPDLQALGDLAGWHHPSPFMLGIDPDWGSWYAYRALLLVDAAFLPSDRVEHRSPCETCADAPCVTACPADAVAAGDFRLERCLDFRRAARSTCRHTCLSRIACPVGAQHRYPDDLLRHTYGHSLKMLIE